MSGTPPPLTAPGNLRGRQEDARERHERELIEEILHENENPFQRAGAAITSRWSYLYNNYLYTSGVLLVAFGCWSLYPSYVRFRHVHIMRYHRNQLKFRRWFFSSNHMPKWDKKYLQEVVLPPLPSAPAVSVESILASQQSATRAAASVRATAAEAMAATPAPGDAASKEVSVHTATPSALSPAEMDTKFNRTQNLLEVTTLNTRRSATSTFGKGESRDSERQFNKSLQLINQKYFTSQKTQFTERYQASGDPQQLRADIMEAVKQAKTTVVLKETHETVKSIPAGYEVWWLSADEARRTRFCKFWIGGLLFARLLQDLLDMPEMPDFVQ